MADILILTALPLETRAVEKALRAARRNRHEGTPHLPNCIVRCVGMRAAGLKLLSPKKETLVVFVGIAGGLHPRLRVGDVVVDGPAGVSEFSRAGRSFTVHHGRMTTSAQPISEPAEKRALFARSGALAVDMEDEIASHWAAARGLSFMTIRGISDAADDRLDPAIFRFVGPDGRPRSKMIARELLRRPLLVRHLMRVSRCARVAAANAANVLGFWLNVGRNGGQG